MALAGALWARGGRVRPRDPGGPQPSRPGSRGLGREAGDSAGLGSAGEAGVAWPLPVTVICVFGPLRLPASPLRWMQGGGVGWGRGEQAG